MNCKAKNRTLINWLCVFGISFFAGGCSPSMNDYKDTVRDGIKTVPHVQEIKQIFPNAPTDHFITQYGFDKSVPVAWNTVVYFYGRYEMDYQVDVMVDYEHNRVSKMEGIPQFRLMEVAPNHPVVGIFTSGHTIFEKDWEKVVAAKGDFSVIGINLITNSPVAGFDDYVHGWRKDRVQVER
jgi:hypothetical protein